MGKNETKILDKSISVAGLISEAVKASFILAEELDIKVNELDVKVNGFQIFVFA